MSTFLASLFGLIAANPPDNRGATLWQRGNQPAPEVFQFSPNLRIGVVDQNGNFVPWLNESLRARGGVWPAFMPLVHSKGGQSRNCYEHRSGSLIPGKLLDTKFYPDYGTKLLLLSNQIGPGKLDMLVYNRLESNADFWTKEKREKFPNGLPPDEAPVTTYSIPDGYKLLTFSKAYPEAFPVKDPFVIRVMGEVAEYGKLDQDGDFIPDYELPVIPKTTAPKEAKAAIHPEGKWRFIYNVPKDNLKTEAVYEFRGGRLIEGTLDNTGNFAPKPESTVLNFKNYRPKTDLRIYNLPGILVAVPPAKGP
jgi:hypothetical protein